MIVQNDTTQYVQPTNAAAGVIDTSTHRQWRIVVDAGIAVYARWGTAATVVGDVVVAGATRDTYLAAGVETLLTKPSTSHTRLVLRTAAGAATVHAQPVEV